MIYAASDQSAEPAIRRRLHGGMRIVLLAGFVLLAGAAVSPPLVAQQSVSTRQAQVPLSIELKQFKVVKGPDGKERFIEAAKVMPGDIVEYRATYHNNLKQPITRLAANVPIPEGTRYIPKSAVPSNTVQLAAKDGQFGPEPLMRKVKGADGKFIAVPVAYNEIRSLRWPIGRLEAASEITVKARVQVDKYDRTARAEVIPSQAQPGGKI